MTYREHSEIAKAHVRAGLRQLVDPHEVALLDELVGWMQAAGFDTARVVEARGLLRQELNVLVVGHEESEVSDE